MSVCLSVSVVVWWGASVSVHRALRVSPTSRVKPSLSPRQSPPPPDLIIVIIVSSFQWSWRRRRCPSSSDLPGSQPALSATSTDAFGTFWFFVAFIQWRSRVHLVRVHLVRVRVRVQASRSDRVSKSCHSQSKHMILSQSTKYVQCNLC